MATRSTPSHSEEHSFTAERVGRLFRIISRLAEKPLARAALLRRLGVNQRSFYRDLGLLRELGIPVTTAQGRYRLEIDVPSALSRLPFPDPRLTLGQAMALARGRSAAHRLLQSRVAEITGVKNR
jgi:predicted DNA-binding transcriptional regulator YafY